MRCSSLIALLALGCAPEGAVVHVVFEADGAEGLVDVVVDDAVAPGLGFLDAAVGPRDRAGLSIGDIHTWTLPKGQYLFRVVGELDPRPDCDDPGAWARWEGEVEVNVAKQTMDLVRPPGVDTWPGDEVAVFVPLVPSCL